MIPDNFGSARELEDLYLNNNRLTGMIPGITVTEFRNVKELRFDSNELTGTMPASICALNLDASNNETLTADCGVPVQVECDCCTDCL